MNCSVNSASSEKAFVRRVDDSVNLQPTDISAHQTDLFVNLLVRLQEKKGKKKGKKSFLFRLKVAGLLRSRETLLHLPALRTSQSPQPKS
jgi:hypothetical protein